MQQASEELRFEDAMEYRDLIQSIQKIGERQKITGHSGEDNDVIAMAMDGEDAIVQVFFIRGGRLIGRDHFYLKVAGGDTRSQDRYLCDDQFSKTVLRWNAVYSP